MKKIDRGRGGGSIFYRSSEGFLFFNGIQYFIFDIVRVDAFVGLFGGCGCFACVDILFVTLRLARRPPTWEMTVQMVLADDVFWVLTNFVLYFPTVCLGLNLGLNCVSSRKFSH